MVWKKSDGACMKPYWAGMVVGYLGALVFGTFLYGCATSLASVFVVVGLISACMFDGLVAACLGPESWQHDIKLAGWGRVSLGLTGMAVGSVPILVSYACFGSSLSAVLASKPRMLAGLSLFFFGVPIASWIATLALVKQSRNRLKAQPPPGFYQNHEPRQDD
ncbi:MAG: hypothetical protein AAGC44_14715 [Planctomycetota bacterium]